MGGSTRLRIGFLLKEIQHRCPLGEGPAFLSNECWRFPRRLLMPRSTERATVPAALEHPWLQEPWSLGWLEPSKLLKLLPPSERESFTRSQGSISTGTPESDDESESTDGEQWPLFFGTFLGLKHAGGVRQQC